MNEAFFPFGTQYAPLPDFVGPEEFVGDMGRMRDLGFTIVRGLTSWGAVERRPGELDWRIPDALFEAAEKTGMGVTMTVGLSAPEWFLRAGTREGIVNWEGRRTGRTQRQRPCPHDPSYLEASEGFIRALAGRYRSSGALHSWVSMNEPHLHYHDIVCYCQHSVRTFRRWLSSRHGSLAGLNDAWGTDYDNWDQVEPPDGPLTGWGRYPRWIDWRAFADDSLTAYVRWVSDTIQSVDPDHPTHTNLLTAPLVYNPTPVGCDPFQMAGAVDSLGCSIYVLASNGDLPFLHSMCVDVIRSAADVYGKECWVTEMQGGPTIWAHQRSVTPTPAQIAAWPWQAIGRGARGFIYWLWRPRMGSKDSGWEGGEFGLADKLGRPRPRAVAAGGVATAIARELPLLRAAKHRSEVALLRSQTCYNVAYGEIADEAMSGPLGGERRYYTQSVLGAYKMLWDSSVPMRFVDPALLGQGLEGLKVLLMPFCYLLDAAAADGLRRFVAGGGVVIADLACAMKNERGEVHLHSPGGLVDVFGAEQLDVESAGDGLIRLDQPSPAIPISEPVTLQPHVFKEILEPRDGARVVARYSTGEPAIIVNRYGRGTTILVGTLLFRRYLLEQDDAWRSVVYGALRSAGAWCPIRITTGDAEADRAIEGAPLVVPDGLLLVLVNHHGREAFVELSVDGSYAAARDLMSRESVDLTSDGPHTRVGLQLPPGGTLALHLVGEH